MNGGRTERRDRVGGRYCVAYRLHQRAPGLFDSLDGFAGQRRTPLAGLGRTEERHILSRSFRRVPLLPFCFFDFPHVFETAALYSSGDSRRVLTKAEEIGNLGR